MKFFCTFYDPYIPKAVLSDEKITYEIENITRLSDKWFAKNTLTRDKILRNLVNNEKTSSKAENMIWDVLEWLDDNTDVKIEYIKAKSATNNTNQVCAKFRVFLSDDDYMLYLMKWKGEFND